MSNILPDPRGLAVAEMVSRWFLGDPGWAFTLIDAYLNPERALAELQIEKETW